MCYDSQHRDIAYFFCSYTQTDVEQKRLRVPESGENTRAGASLWKITHTWPNLPHPHASFLLAFRSQRGIIGPQRCKQLCVKHLTVRIVVYKIRVKKITLGNNILNYSCFCVYVICVCERWKSKSTYICPSGLVQEIGAEKVSAQQQVVRVRQTADILFQNVASVHSGSGCYNELFCGWIVYSGPARPFVYVSERVISTLQT